MALTRVLGNVHADGVRAVWNGEPYLLARRMVSHPRSARSDPAHRGPFCHGCPKIYETDGGDRYPRGDAHDFEEFQKSAPPGRGTRLPVRLHVVDGAASAAS